MKKKKLISYYAIIIDHHNHLVESMKMVAYPVLFKTQSASYCRFVMYIVLMPRMG